MRKLPNGVCINAPDTCTRKQKDRTESAANKGVSGMGKHTLLTQIDCLSAQESMGGEGNGPLFHYTPSSI